MPPAFRAQAAVVALLGVGAGCDVRIRDGDVSVAPAREWATHEVRRTYPLSPGGVVEVVNTAGDITVATGGAGQVELTAVLRAGGMSEERAAKVVADSRVDERVAPDRLRFATIRGQESGRLEAIYTLTVPEDARLDLTTHNGTISAAGLRGSVTAMVVNGDVELDRMRGGVDAAAVNGALRVSLAAVTARVRLEGTNGRMALELPPDARAALSARAVNGGIVVTGLGVPDTTGGRRLRTLESALNGGGPEIELRMTNGQIALTATGASPRR